MNAVSKTVLVVGIAAIGVYSCAKMLSRAPSNETEASNGWKLVTMGSRQSAAPDSAGETSNSAATPKSVSETVPLSSGTDSFARSINPSSEHRPESDSGRTTNAVDNQHGEFLVRNLPDIESDLLLIDELSPIAESGQRPLAIPTPPSTPLARRLPKPDAEQRASAPSAIPMVVIDKSQDQNVVSSTEMESQRGGLTETVSNPFAGSGGSFQPANTRTNIASTLGSNFQSAATDNRSSQRVQNQFAGQMVASDPTGNSDSSPVNQDIKNRFVDSSTGTSSMAATTESHELTSPGFKPASQHNPPAQQPNLAATNSGFVPNTAVHIETAEEPLQVVEAPIQLPVETEPLPLSISEPLVTPSANSLVQEVPDRNESQVSQVNFQVNSQVVGQRAIQHITYGKSLARRGAMFAARQEFMQALRVIAESRDIQSHSREHVGKLASAIRALTESDDFIAVDTEQQMSMDLRSILETHETKLIDPATTESLLPIQAMQTYYAFAGEQLVEAVGQSPVASEALYSLGKLMTTAARFDSSGKPLDRAKAMVMHQAALSASPANYLSANELGVLYASHGRWQQALDLFSQSLRTKQTAASWKNLASVHEQISLASRDQKQKQEQADLAALAMNEFKIFGNATKEMDIVLQDDWTSAADFSDLAATPEMEGQSQSIESPSVEVAGKPVKKGLLRNMKDWF